MSTPPNPGPHSDPVGGDRPPAQRADGTADARATKVVGPPRREIASFQRSWEHAPVAVAVVTGPAHTLVYANPALRRLGAGEESTEPHAEVWTGVGTPAADAFPPTCAGVIVALLDAARRVGGAVRSTISTGPPGAADLWQCTAWPLGGAVPAVIDDATPRADAAGVMLPLVVAIDVSRHAGSARSRQRDLTELVLLSALREEERADAADLARRESRFDSLRAQLNPHFLFNALNTIAMLVRRGAREDAIRGIVGLAQLLRQALREGSAAEVPLRAELELVRHYLEIERLRLRERLWTHVDAAPDVLDALVPSLILQPLVENAVRHGIARRVESGRIDIICRRHDGGLLLEVCDEGPGFPAGWSLATSQGIGLANTRERLQHLYGPAHRFEAENAPGRGTVVRAVIPLRLA